jgi:hypothetical protein
MRKSWKINDILSINRANRIMTVDPKIAPKPTMSSQRPARLMRCITLLLASTLNKKYVNTLRTVKTKMKLDIASETYTVS